MLWVVLKNTFLSLMNCITCFQAHFSHDQRHLQQNWSQSDPAHIDSNSFEEALHFQVKTAMQTKRLKGLFHNLSQLASL